MLADLPSFTPETFAAGIEACSPEALDAGAIAALLAHYQELVRWNRTVSLIGPGTREEIFSRHYGEALAALPLIRREARELVDIGSGAGFPGLVLAAARPGLHVTLVEARERKWAFLSAVCRRASLSCHCLNARVTIPLPAGLPDAVDVVTVRAVRLDSAVQAALAERLHPEGRILLWTGEDRPDGPANLRVVRELALAGSARRRILELRRVPTEPETPKA